MKWIHLLFAFFASIASSAEMEPPASEQELQIEQTLSIIKPDAVQHNQIGEILEYFENAGLRVVGSKMVKLTPEQARAFYAVHKDKAFFNDLIAFMTSGPVIVQVLEGEDAVAINRQVMGATDPLKASPGTIRADFGTDVQRNAVHGSDSPENAKKEIGFFFKSEEIHSSCLK
jgi:nucleoside-diphosphate kinase